MPLYSYTSVDMAGAASSGVQEAADEHDLARLLREKGFLLLRAVLKDTRPSALSRFMDVANGMFGVSTEEILMLIRNLKVMVNAGVPLPKVLDILSVQSKNLAMRKALVSMREKITQGFSLSQAMALHPAIFSELFVNMTRVGEESGTLDQALSQLVMQTERAYDLTSKIKSAMMYPAVILAAMIIIGVIMLVYVVPKLADSFRELGITLPASTRFVIGLADF
ncbi:MAG: type II secretion system F family protein, partial [Candidatus Wildermuthbacteria bacterium]|nr:type II secretion system F family protein [Candidatus Wildermuthbacteria bacterium]